MKHSQSTDDFFKKVTNFANSQKPPHDANKIDIGSQFEEFLQRRNEKPNDQCENPLNVNNCNYDPLLQFDKARQYQYDPMKANYGNEFCMSQSRSGMHHENILSNNLQKYNSPSSPYSA